ncbi:MAG: PaaX family transcriptional regulator C-terminal domain-containing protein [Patescibacteria group bacterium]
MSLIDDVLIAVEDRKNIGTIELHGVLSPASKQAVFSAVGRLIKQNFLKHSGGDVAITQKGKDYIYRNLDAIEKFSQTDRPFVLVLFEIPESQKVTREKFRTSLNQLGFGSLKRGIMLGAAASVADAMKYVKELHLEQRVIVLNIESAANVMRSRFMPWNFSKINQSYQKFIDRAERIISTKQNEDTRIKAKQLVLQFARASKLDPVLPKSMNNQDYLGYRALELYQQLKPLCYE